MFYVQSKVLLIHFNDIVFHLDDTDIAKIEQRAKIAERNVEELEDVRCKLDARVAELQKQLIEKDQKIESLTSELRRMEIYARNTERTGKEIPPKPIPRVRMYVCTCTILIYMNYLAASK